MALACSIQVPMLHKSINEQLSRDVADGFHMGFEEAMQHLKNLEVINECQKLADAIRDGYKIPSLDLSFSNLPIEALPEIVAAICHPNSKVCALDMSNTYLGETGAMYLAKALSRSKLVYLNISGCGIGDLGAAHLARAFGTNQCQLVSLDVSNNDLSNKSVILLARSCRSEKCVLTELNLKYNKVDHRAALGFEKLLRRKRNVVFHVSDESFFSRSHYRRMLEAAFTNIHSSLRALELYF